MLRLSALCFAAFTLNAQNPADLFNKPPAGVDEALRARISEFYQLHVKQQFRQAESLVAKDTQEFFYTKNKPQYLSFEISRIEYSKDFTHAKATMITEQYIMMPGFTDKPMKVPSPSTWKLEDGKWCWYVDPESLRESPFGKMTGGPGPAGGLPVALPSVESIMGKVKAGPRAVTLKPGESAEVTFTNSAPGYMDLQLLEAAKDTEAAFDRPQMKPNGGTAVLKIVAGKAPKSGEISVRVVQTGEIISIGVTVK